MAQLEKHVADADVHVGDAVAEARQNVEKEYTEIIQVCARSTVHGRRPPLVLSVLRFYSIDICYRLQLLSPWLLLAQKSLLPPPALSN